MKVTQGDSRGLKRTKATHVDQEDSRGLKVINTVTQSRAPLMENAVARTPTAFSVR